MLCPNWKSHVFHTPVLEEWVLVCRARWRKHPTWQHLRLHLENTGERGCHLEYLLLQKRFRQELMKPYQIYQGRWLFTVISSSGEKVILMKKRGKSSWGVGGVATEMYRKRNRAQQREGGTDANRYHLLRSHSFKRRTQAWLQNDCSNSRTAYFRIKADVQKLPKVVGYLQKFAPKLSEEAAPLGERLKKSVHFRWDPAVHGTVLDKVKKTLSETPVLRYLILQKILKSLCCVMLQRMALVPACQLGNQFSMYLVHSLNRKTLCANRKRYASHSVWSEMIWDIRLRPSHQSWDRSQATWSVWKKKKSCRHQNT